MLVEELERASRYASLRTFRRSGSPVDTPLWFAVHDGRVVMFTSADTGKLKRLRNSDRAEVAACDARGRLRGTWQTARARVIEDDAQAERIYSALRERYRLQFRLLEWGARLAGRRRRWRALEVELLA